MYLYFNKDGRLLEFINDTQARQINTNVNKIYCFYEDINDNINAMTVKFRFDDDSYYPSSGFAITGETTVKDIEYDKSRDLKYFKYFTDYKFFVYNIPNEVLAKGGSVECALSLENQTSQIIQGLEKFTFFITDGLVTNDDLITFSQYTFLLLYLSNVVANYYTKNETNAIVDTAKNSAFNYTNIKINQLSDIYYDKNEVDEKIVDTKRYIDRVSRKLAFGKSDWLKIRDGEYYIYLSKNITQQDDTNYMLQLVEDEEIITVNSQIQGSKTILDTIFKANNGGIYLSSNKMYAGKIYLTKTAKNITFDVDDWELDGDEYKITFSSIATSFDDENFIAQINKDSNQDIAMSELNGVNILADTMLKGEDGSLTLKSNVPFSGKVNLIPKQQSSVFDSDDWETKDNIYQLFIPAGDIDNDNFIIQIGIEEDEGYSIVNDVVFKTVNGGILLESNVAFSGIAMLINASLQGYQAIDRIVFVNSLPEVGDARILYFVLREVGEEQNYYDEYIWHGQWEKIGC